MLFKKIQNNLKMLEKMPISMIPFTPSLVQVKYDKIKTINFRRNTNGI